MTHDLSPESRTTMEEIVRLAFAHLKATVRSDQHVPVGRAADLLSSAITAAYYAGWRSGREGTELPQDAIKELFQIFEET